MKKYRVTFFLFLLCVSSVFGAYQFNNKGNQTWLTFDSNTAVYFSVQRSGKDKDHVNFIDRGNGIADWGWYNLNTEEVGSFKNSGEATFTQSDKIALWVRDVDGETYNSAKQPEQFIWGKSDLIDGIVLVYGGNKGSNGSHEHYVFQITNPPDNNTPNGQPLPGIIGTLLVGGTGIWYLKNRKKLLRN